MRGVDLENNQQPYQFTPKEFDSWAEKYDEEVQNEIAFPFIGYRELMSGMVTLAGELTGKQVLDLGCGTGNLGGYFREFGAVVWSTDFSPEMIKRAQVKFPGQPFEIQDVRQPLPDYYPLRYDLITSAYVFHHFPQYEKLALVERYMRKHLHPGGKLLIGDLAFKDQSARGLTQMAYPETWDDEYYWMLDDDVKAFQDAGILMEVLSINFCASILMFKV